MIEMYRPDVLRGLKRPYKMRHSKVIVNEFLESGNNYVLLDYENCGCRPSSKMTNINRYTFKNSISVKVIVVEDDYYMVRIDGNEKNYRGEISKLYK